VAERWLRSRRRSKALKQIVHAIGTELVSMEKAISTAEFREAQQGAIQFAWHQAAFFGWRARKGVGEAQGQYNLRRME